VVIAMKRLITLLVFVCLASLAWAQQTKEDVESRMDQASTTFKVINSQAENGIPPEVLKQARCVAIVPSVVKVGFILGGKHGRGVSTCKLPDGSWSAPAFFEITGGSIGAQVGGSSTQLVMIITSEEGKHELYRGKFKFSGGASAVAGPVGNQVSAADAWKLNSGILTYARAEGGLFAGADLGGANFSADDDATLALYGKDINSRDLLTGKVPAPESAHTLLAAVERTQAAAMAKQPNQPKTDNQQ
jgi:SH3 domain-containing YSC84-like protein 1